MQKAANVCVKSSAWHKRNAESERNQLLVAGMVAILQLAQFVHQSIMINKGLLRLLKLAQKNLLTSTIKCIMRQLYACRCKPGHIIPSPESTTLGSKVWLSETAPARRGNTEHIIPSPESTAMGASCVVLTDGIYTSTDGLHTHKSYILLQFLSIFVFFIVCNRMPDSEGVIPNSIKLVPSLQGSLDVHLPMHHSWAVPTDSR